MSTSRARSRSRSRDRSQIFIKSLPTNRDCIDAFSTPDIQACIAACNAVLCDRRTEEVLRKKNEDDMRALRLLFEKAAQLWVSVTGRMSKVIDEIHTHADYTKEWQNKMWRTATSASVAPSVDVKFVWTWPSTDNSDCWEPKTDYQKLLDTKMRTCLAYALGVAEGQSVVTTTKQDLSFDDDVPCKNECCWYGGNIDRRGEFTHSTGYALFVDIGEWCNLCWPPGNISDLALEELKDEHDMVYMFWKYLHARGI